MGSWTVLAGLVVAVWASSGDARADAIGRQAGVAPHGAKRVVQRPKAVVVPTVAPMRRPVTVGRVAQPRGVPAWEPYTIDAPGRRMQRAYRHDPYRLDRHHRDYPNDDVPGRDGNWGNN